MVTSLIRVFLQPSGSYIPSRNSLVSLCVSCSLSTTLVPIIERPVRISTAKCCLFRTLAALHSSCPTARAKLFPSNHAGVTSKLPEARSHPQTTQSPPQASCLLAVVCRRLAVGCSMLDVRCWHPPNSSPLPLPRRHRNPGVPEELPAVLLLVVKRVPLAQVLSIVRLKRLPPHHFLLNFAPVDGSDRRLELELWGS